jgi:nucleotide-binding universal stress UspA family protein
VDEGDRPEKSGALRRVGQGSLGGDSPLEDVVTVLVGYTRTPEGEAALERAVAEAKLREARLVIVHSRRTGEDRDAAEIVMYTELLEEIGSRLDGEGVSHTIHDFIQDRSPAEDILDTATEEGAELIVVGLRPRSKTGKYLFGSTAQDVILDAPCPVLSVRAPGQVP